MSDSTVCEGGRHCTCPAGPAELEECFDCQVDEEERELYDYPTLAGCIRLCGDCIAERQEAEDA